LFKYIDPAESGAVLPIVHVNGYKISQRTIYGTMDDKEVVALFRCVHFWHVGAEVMTVSAAEVGMVIRFALWKT
jgi:phosphoketolase